MGISMPRNSYSQSHVGGIGKRFGSKSGIAEKLEFLEKEGKSGITTLYFPGHIMLFIGFIDGRPYAVHNIWAYTQRIGSEDIVRIINKVAVTDLFLGSETRRGSFMDRLSVIRVVSK